MSDELEAVRQIVFDVTNAKTDADAVKILRSYGDTRERAGLERAATHCADKANDYSRFSDPHEVCLGLADEIRRDLIVPAPDAGGAVKETRP